MMEMKDLSAFVDRVPEINNFCRMLETGSKPIMVVWGEKGYGKSELVWRMIEKCKPLKLKQALIEWNDFYSYDYLEVMCQIRDQIGAAKHFTKFTRLVKTSDPVTRLDMVYRDKGSSSVAKGANISGSVGKLANIIVEKQTNQFLYPKEEIDRLASARMVRLTDEFILGLAKATGDGIAVIFFDENAKMPDMTRKWIWGGLFKAVIRKKLSNVRFVLCGENDPQPQIGNDFLDLVAPAKLNPLGLGDITQYLTKRFEKAELDVKDERVVKALALSVFAQTDRYPGSISKSAYLLIESIKNNGL